jgi:hypothetical protein
MLTEADAKYWTPAPQVVSWVASQIPEGARVLEIGPGAQPFPRADHFVDWRDWGHVPRNRLSIADLQKDRLPFTDKEFDFVYCRHVLEDMVYPFPLCDEMSRIAKAGYIETPSPLAEMCRGIDGGSPPWRGYIHHRFLVWPEKGELRFLAKYPVIEFIDLGDEEPRIAEALRRAPHLWNSYFLWQGEIRWRFLQHHAEYMITTEYAATVAAALHAGITASDHFVKPLKSAMIVG